ncbi:MAG: hypothetical protein LQ342_007362 [Letrouitia transgressa]|nr:MAG: hypothetical protein LQ342_007362 [Letrouitia transgressa]
MARMGKSSKDKRDAYYRLAKEQGWRARSAFKLIQLDEQFNLFASATRVVDLCAAPGSWSQVLSRVLVKGEGFGRRRWEEKQRRERAVIFGSIDDINTVYDAENGEEELKPKENVRIVAVDLQPMAPLPGIITLVGDITHPSTPPRILEALNPTSSPLTSGSPNENQLVDLVLCDGAPDVTGLHDLDIYIQFSLLRSALALSLRILKQSTGKFVAKIFRAKECDFVYAQLKCFFEKVTVAKPRSSRASSLEAFVVCEGYMGVPKGYEIGDETDLIRWTGKEKPKKSVQEVKETREGFVNGQRRTVRDDGVKVLELDDEDEDEEDTIHGNRWIAPFVACGDLSAWDADATYHLPKDRVSLDPVQPPTAPPYKRALELRKQRGGFYGKTGKEKDIG